MIWNTKAFAQQAGHLSQAVSSMGDMSCVVWHPEVLLRKGGPRLRMPLGEGAAASGTNAMSTCSSPAKASTTCRRNGCGAWQQEGLSCWRAYVPPLCHCPHLRQL